MLQAIDPSNSTYQFCLSKVSQILTNHNIETFYIIYPQQLVKAVTPVCPDCQHVPEANWRCLTPKIGRTALKHSTSGENSLELSILGNSVTSECVDEEVLPLTTYSLLYFKVSMDEYCCSDIDPVPFLEPQSQPVCAT